MSTVLVTGATGKQGGAVIKALLEGKKVAIRALVRKPDAESAKALASKGVELAKGEFGDKASLVSALKGVSSAFLLTTPWSGGGADSETAQGTEFIDAAKEAHVPHIVYSSVDGAERNSGIPHFEAKWKVEKYLEKSGIPHTILRPVAFYENWPTEPTPYSALPAFETELKGKKLQIVSVKDIGWFAARALEAPDEYTGRKVQIAGDELTIPEVAQTYAKVFNTEPPALPKTDISGFPEDMQLMLRWFYTDGYTASVAECKKANPDLLSFEEWLLSHKK